MKNQKSAANAKKSFVKKSVKPAANESKEKRYSKAKIKSDAVKENNVKKETIKQTKKEEVQSRKEYYQAQFANRNEKMLIHGKPTRTFAGILTNHSIQRNGISVLPKGQCVMVTIFSDGVIENHYCLVSSTDGRKGVASITDVKPMFAR